MNNQTSMPEFLLLGFSDIWELQILHFTAFLVVYLAALIGNLLIIIVVAFDRQLHTPMYFFLVNLSFLDLCYISVTVPKSMANSLMDSRTISFSGCVAQLFLVVTFAITELALLTVMAYDRYVAICHPLHYRMLMNKGRCAQMAAGAWLSSMMCAVIHTGNTFRLRFCHSNMVGQFFCNIPQLLKLSCGDTRVNDIVMLVLGSVSAVSCFVFIFVSYIHILFTVMRIPSKQGRYKAFSTCLPHLIVFCLFLGTSTLTYMGPRSKSSKASDLVAAIFYSVVPPTVNPIIYSLRNNEIRGALRKMLIAHQPGPICIRWI
ncbi:olfactory receptor 14A16-like [Mauremys mutica]|uniref:olfactory receptor 14A16-like n=1 Tax=Mauremys mutica TaxID=74926 RepID=UPI001D1694B1|nr:olfactory receptor 14A16-like [Mauremys mutica]